MTSSTEESRAARSSPRGTSNGTRFSESVRFARTIRWAMVGSGTRNARAISSVVNPPSNRKARATRASGESTGWQAVNSRRSRSSPMSLSIAVSISSTAISCCASSSRPISSCLRSSRLFLRRWSMARCFAVAISQAPGLSGILDCGHCSSAATRASWASSSARPMSRTIRVSAAISFADSIFQTASMARCVSLWVTTTHHTIFNPAAQDAAYNASPLVRQLCSLFWLARGKIFEPEDLANLGFALPLLPMFLVPFHEAHGALKSLFLGLQLEHGKSADDFFGLAVWPVDYSQLSAANSNVGARRGRREATAREHRVRLGCFLAELVDGIHQRLWRRAREPLGVVNQHHESHL